MQRLRSCPHPIEYDTGFTLLPGKYMIKFLARDDETGRIGTYELHLRSQPQQGGAARSHQLRRAQQPARGFEPGALQCREGEG